MEYIDQSASNLQLTIVKGDLDLKQFNVISECTKSAFGMEIILRIIGGSHLITYKINQIEIHEIFACQNVKDEVPCVLCGPLKEVIADIKLSFNGKISYHFISSIESKKSGIKKLEKIEVLAKEVESENRGLTYSFPKKNEVSPKTIIYMKSPKDGNIEIETVHFYPNENQIVFSKTSIKKDGGK